MNNEQKEFIAGLIGAILGGIALHFIGISNPVRFVTLGVLIIGIYQILGLSLWTWKND
ncbi:hypothetical protein GOV13_02650 [Candidatus Pacearchaeota archaeon]|nr:hypothetical protein [Candidatus Pacearchaeota archaeon]